MTRVVAIHQPEYFPVPSVVGKLLQADVFVLLDTVDFNRENLQHRLKIKTDQGAQWLTIPVLHATPQRIHDVVTADDRWLTGHPKSLQLAYGKAPCFDAIWPALAPFWVIRYKYLADATRAAMVWLAAMFAAPAQLAMVPAGVQARKGDLVLAICQRLGATAYLSGVSGAQYLDRAAFAAAGIEVQVQALQLPAYPQRFGPFVSGLSVLDALFNVGVAEVRGWLR